MSNEPTLQPPPLPPAVIPYASPAAYDPAAVAGVWQDGDALVAANGATLPCRCIKCNATVDRSRGIKKDYYWHEPLLYLLILAGVLIYAIVALIVRKKGTVVFFLCDAHRARRRNAMVAAWLLIPGGIVALIAGAANESGLIAIAGVGLFIGGIVAAVLSQAFAPKRIDAHYLRLKGAGPAFLAGLPGIVRG